MKNTITPTTKALFFTSVFAVILDIARVGISQKANFAFLIWNLFLAWIPYMLATALHKNTSTKSFVAIFVPWLLFFPNAAYLITDILHVDNRPPIPLWYDSLIFFIFAWLGIMLATISLMRVHVYLEHRFGKVRALGSIAIISFLTAFGIYLGRFERWNSWDVLLNPAALLNNIVDIWKNIPHTSEPVLFVIVFAATILSSYYVVREIIRDKELG